MLIQPNLSQLCTRAHVGSTDRAASTATATVNGEYQRAVGRLRVSEAMVSSRIPPTSRMTMGARAFQSTLGVAMRAAELAARTEREAITTRSPGPGRTGQRSRPW